MSALLPRTMAPSESVSYSSKALLLFWAMLICSLAIAQGTEGEALSRFERTVSGLQAQGPEPRSAFALSAISELAGVYIAEADLARAQAAAKSGGKRAELLAWAASVDQYAERLLLVMEDVELGFPVNLRPGRKGPASITVTDRLVILGHPRVDQQLAYERRVLDDFCSDHDCRMLTERPEHQEPIPVSRARVNPVWTFSPSGATCANEGVELVFDRTPDMAILRGLCEELAMEVATLLTAVGEQIQYGVVVDWERLSVSKGQNRGEYLVLLNATGDSLLLDIPILYGSDSLLDDLSPWLAARSRGDAQAMVRLDASRYGWIEPRR